MKNTLSNMILVLGGISLVAAAAVGLVYRVTAEPIALAKEANTRAALAGVLAEFDDTSSKTIVLDGMNIVVYTATKGGNVVGYAVETATQKGYSGEFRLMVGFTPASEVYKIQVLEHSETPGLGSKMTEEGNPLFASFEGKNPSAMQLSVKKDGGEVDALTAATITSRAYVDAVARAYNALAEQTGTTGVEAVTGATSPEGTSDATDAASAATATTDTTTVATPQNQQGKEASNE
ncbi:MAG: RnfABCDGE type electron transport complex subunit G [Rikenellaceae bacterium]|nr:RnfABCDGE type electron transport complex subunit G [Rikenellaceae bacterium]